jgi:uncharacterized beta-barrel protein YwiB (DUF1934 family)
MSIPVMLAIKGKQVYIDQDPDEIELMTDGSLEWKDGGWDICYQESALTGLDGVATTFRVEADKIILTRTGKLHSQMVFQDGVEHDSLYASEFGALHITVCATQMDAHLNENGGTVDLRYNIEIEKSQAGYIEYHLDVHAKH